MCADGTARARIVGNRLKLEDVASAVGVTNGTVSRWFSGDMFPGRDAGLRLAALLDSLPAVETVHA